MSASDSTWYDSSRLEGFKLKWTIFLLIKFKPNSESVRLKTLDEIKVKNKNNKEAKCNSAEI